MDNLFVVKRAKGKHMVVKRLKAQTEEDKYREGKVKPKLSERKMVY